MVVDVDLDALCAVVRQTLMAVAASTERDLPPFRVVDVVHLGDTILCAFEQLDGQFPDTILVWTMPVPENLGTVAVAEAIVTENFLEDLELAGPGGWKNHMPTRIGRLLFV
jgi:hypothetical protein